MHITAVGAMEPSDSHFIQNWKPRMITMGPLGQLKLMNKVIRHVTPHRKDVFSVPFATFHSKHVTYRNRIVSWFSNICNGSFTFWWQHESVFNERIFMHGCIDVTTGHMTAHLEIKQFNIKEKG
jgi:hypothetical protein